MLAISKVILKVNYDVRIFRKAPVQFCGIARNKIFQKINIQLNFYYSNIIPQINIQENYSKYFTSLTHSCHWSVSISLENIRKPPFRCCFHGE